MRYERKQARNSMEETSRHASASRYTLSICAIVVLTTTLGFAAQKQYIASGPFNKVWIVPLSQYNQADETGNSLTQLSNGTIVAGGNDANQHNYCSTHRQPYFGGA